MKYKSKKVRSRNESIQKSASDAARWLLSAVIIHYLSWKNPPAAERQTLSRTLQRLLSAPVLQQDAACCVWGFFLRDAEGPYPRPLFLGGVGRLPTQVCLAPKQKAIIFSLFGPSPVSRVTLSLQFTQHILTDMDFFSSKIHKVILLLCCCD